MSHLRLDDMPELARVEQVARWADVSRGAIYAEIRSGRLPALTFGRVVRVPRAALRDWVERSMRICDARTSETPHHSTTCTTRDEVIPRQDDRGRTYAQTLRRVRVVAAVARQVEDPAGSQGTRPGDQ